MAIKLSPLLANPDFRRRLAVTLAAMVAYRLGSFVPLTIQGLPLNEWSEAFFTHGLTRWSVSVFALGITPFFSILILFELAKLVFPALKRWEAATPGNAARLHSYIFAGALAIAAFQAINLVKGLEKIAAPRMTSCIGCAHHPLTIPDPLYTYATVLTILAGTALVGWLIIQITFRGLGNGIWFLYVASAIEDLRQYLARSLEMMRAHLLDASTLEINAGFLIAAVAVLVTVDLPWQEGGARRAQANGFGTGSALAATIWPPVLATVASSILLWPATLFLNGALPPHWLHYANVAAVAVLILLFTAPYCARGSELESGQDGAMKPFLTMALAQIAIWLGTEALMLAEATMLNAPLRIFYINANAIIIFVAVAVRLLRFRQDY